MSDTTVFQATVEASGQAVHFPELFSLELTADVVKFLRRITAVVQAFSEISGEFTHVEYLVERGAAKWLYLPDDFTPPFVTWVGPASEMLSGIPATFPDTLVQVRRDGLVFKTASALECFTHPAPIDGIAL